MSSPPPPPGWSPQSGPSWPAAPGSPGGTPPGPPPPGYGPPPGPGFGMPPGSGPAPKKSNTGLIVGLILGGGFIVILVVALILVVTVVNAEDDMTPSERLAKAASSLSSAQAVTLKGDFGSTTETLQGELKVSSGGSTTGDVTWKARKVGLLANGDDVYVKGDKSYWQSVITSGSLDFMESSDQKWGKIRQFSLSSYFKRDLTPTGLASRARTVSRYSIRSSTETNVQGQDALRIATSTTTYYVSTGDSPKILRIESRYPKVNADVVQHGGSDAAKTISEIRTRMGELKGSFDTTSTPRVDGKPTFGKCSPGKSCTVSAKAWTTRGTRSEAEVIVYFRFTTAQNGGKYLGMCQDTGKVTSYESVSVSCTVSGSEFASASKGASDIWVRPLAVAGGATEAEIQAMQSALDRQ